MNPFLLRETLNELANRLPPEDEEAEPHDLLDEIVALIEAQTGPQQPLYRFDDGNAAPLPPDLKNLFEVLCYMQALAAFLTTVTADGLFSLFYNHTGADIAHLRAALRRFDPALSGLLEAACALLEGKIDIAADVAFTSRHPDADPFDNIDAATFVQVEQINRTIDECWDSYFETAMNVYNTRDH